MKCIPAIVLLLFVSLTVSCAKSDENDGTAVTATPTPIPLGPDGEPLVTFEPELLLPEAQTQQYTVILPQVRYSLPKDPKATVIVTLAIQASNEDVYKVLEEQKDNLSFVITSALEDQTATSLMNAGAKIALKEDVILKLQERIKGSRGIKKAYLVQFQVFSR
jgi:flagellar basal body-associated protein FliL